MAKGGGVYEMLRDARIGEVVYLKCSREHICPKTTKCRDTQRHLVESSGIIIAFDA